MTNPEHPIDDYDNRLMEQLMAEGGIDPDVLEQRRAAHDVLTEDDAKRDGRESCIKDK